MATDEIKNLPELGIEDDDDDDGPPPGFHSIIAPKQALVNKVEDEDEDDGPPPGFGPVAHKPPVESSAKVCEDDDDAPPPGFRSAAVAPKPPPEPPLVASDKERSSKQDVLEDDDDDGPPPGWEFRSLACALPKMSSNTTDIKVEEKEVNVDEEDDDGPPPGWETVLPNRIPPPSAPKVRPDLKMESKQDVVKNTDKGPQRVSGPTRIPGQSSPPEPQVPSPQSSTLSGERGKGEVRSRIKRPTTGKQPASANQMLPPAPQPPAPAPTSSSPELAQLVCGTCRKLSTYPLGAKWVKCPSCMEVNLAMQVDEVSQVNCKGCSTLLMYPHGAPAVQCTTCRTVTEIGPHNLRASLAAQLKEKRLRRTNRAR